MLTKRPWLKIGLLAIAVTSLFAVFATSKPVEFEATKAQFRPSEAQLLDRNGQLIHELRVDFRGRRLPWINLDAVSPILAKTVIFAEDRHFYDHSGVAWMSLARAAWGAVHGQARGGASTITMQLAALLDPDLQPTHGQRSSAQKWTQIRAALALERAWSKAQILEAYLNLASFRGEIVGVHSASRLLLGKAPSGLNQSEALLLAAMLPAPNGQAARLAQRACVLGQLMNATTSCAGLRDRAKAMLSQPPRDIQRIIDAPHVARQLLSKTNWSVRSTLNGELQRFASETLQRELAQLKTRNVNDGAILAVDNHSGDVLAYAGNGAAASSAIFVDGVRAFRQAGSTLKPFLYELALEKKLLTAASPLDDSPVNIVTKTGLYVPQNYDREFRGWVKVRTALASSLNVPAVKTLALVGGDQFLQRLRDLGFSQLNEGDEFYGPALALGGAEVNLWQLTNAYRTLANEGRHGPLQLSLATKASPGAAPVLDPGGAYIVSDILSDRAARSLSFGLENVLATRYWSAAKTGTSKDMRDNWCIGFSRRYTVGVWVGNFDGSPMTNVSGVTGAAPIWLALMDYLHANSPEPARAMPKNVLRAEVSQSTQGELFLTGTETSGTTLKPAATRQARIAYPRDGEILSLDSDIPDSNQRVRFEAEPENKNYRWVLEDAKNSVTKNGFWWSPQAGKFKLTLVDETGKELDSIRFEVRGQTNKSPS